MEDVNFKYVNQTYGSGPGSKLKTVDVWQNCCNIDSKSFWIIYVHGGAWRDAEEQSETVKPAVASLSKAPWISSVAGFASINYRLSPYPTHPTNPSSRHDPSRNVTHPAHLLDVSEALVFLEFKYNINNRYLLAGHSAGATIIFQQGRAYSLDAPLPQPVCILGIAGIYHFESFRDTHSHAPVYKAFLDPAFPDTSPEVLAFPATDDSPTFAIWECADALIVAHSQNDELVEKDQALIMIESLKRSPKLAGKAHFLEAKGSHDEVYENGDIVAGLIEDALRKTRYSKLVM